MVYENWAGWAIFYLFAFLFLYLLFCFIVSFLGQKKEIGFWDALIVSTLLTPIIGLFIVIASKELAPKKTKIELVALKRESAISKLKESKDLLDLEIINQDEYDKLKKELTPIIKGKS